MNRADDEPRAHIDSTPSLAWCASPDGSGLSFNRSWPDYTSLTAEEALGWGRKVAVPAAVILCVGMCLLAGCHSRTPARAIEFSRIPEANPGGRETQDIIEGFVTGAHTGQRIVLYAKSGRWYVQPLVTHPFTKLTAQAAGMKWTNATHLGTEYAAILVDQGYHPRPVVDELPKLGGQAEGAVVAIASIKGAASPPSKIVEFSGYSWRLRDAPSSRGGVSNNYSSNNVWVDKHGAMHMKIARAGDAWTCAEVSLTTSLGYGTYKVTVRNTSAPAPT